MIASIKGEEMNVFEICKRSEHYSPVPTLLLIVQTSLEDSKFSV